VKPEPFRIEPKFVERIWGMHSLAPLFPEKTNLTEPIGEVWLSGVDCKIVSGPFAGRTLSQAWKEMNAAWRGLKFENEADFPLLLKFIFPTDKLSIQVHPDDAYAALHETASGGHGKTEMWYVVSAERGARLLAGLKPEVTREHFLAALATRTLEELFQSYEVKAGDTFFIPSGMPHTIGPNMVICEVQQYSDITYRIYDYDRRDSNGKPRELHLERALEVMNYGPTVGGRVEPRPVLANPRSVPRFDKMQRLDLVECPYFSTSRFEFDQPMEDHSRIRPAPPQNFSFWVFLEGEGQINWVCHSFDKSGTRIGKLFYKAGECWFLPAVFRSWAYYPKTKTSALLASPHNPKFKSIEYAQVTSPSEKSWIRRLLER
jgi:mannose-6-phosphate isomerase